MKDIRIITGMAIMPFIIWALVFAFTTSFTPVTVAQDNIAIDDSLDWVEQNDPQEIAYYKSVNTDYIHWNKGCWYLRNASDKNIDIVYLLQADIDYFGYHKCKRCIHDDWDDD